MSIMPSWLRSLKEKENKPNYYEATKQGCESSDMIGRWKEETKSETRGGGEVVLISCKSVSGLREHVGSLGFDVYSDNIQL